MLFRASPSVIIRAMKSLAGGIPRRAFLRTSAAAAGTLSVSAPLWLAYGKTKSRASSLAVADLSKVTAPKPVSFPHFPDRLHAFVWRNWPLVAPERMAQVVGAKRADI